jgi:urease accessory protein
MPAVDCGDAAAKTPPAIQLTTGQARRPNMRNGQMNIRLAGGLLAATATLLPATAFAHTGVGPAGGFAHGLAHPISGLDHMLAMVMVGVLAWQIGGRALWLVPATFVLVMALGGMLGVAGVDLPFVEAGIAVSVIVLGAIVAAGIKAPTAVAMGIAALFAVFHGHAHGSEMPADAGGLAYGLGFMLGTALLHLAGIGAGLLIGRIAERHGPLAMRAAGGAAVVAGVGILTGVL